jgi:hypothetical protein
MNMNNRDQAPNVLRTRLDLQSERFPGYTEGKNSENPAVRYTMFYYFYRINWLFVNNTIFAGINDFLQRRKNENNGTLHKQQQRES